MTSDTEVAICSAIDTATEVDLPSGPVDLKQEGLSLRDALLQICDTATVWRSTDGEPYASVTIAGRVEHHAIGSSHFRYWLIHQLATRYRLNGRPASANHNAVRDARSAVEARAILEGTTHPAVLRVTEYADAIYIDLGTEDWSVVRIAHHGWSIQDAAPVPILRGRKTAPFPAPATNGDFGPLRELLHHLDEDAFVLIVAGCLGALLPNGPFPILFFIGEQGSGKSTVARLVRRLTDPTFGDLLQPPGDDRDLIAYARANRVLSFDNLSRISPELADSFCRLATGSEIGGRALHTDHSLASFAACRPLVINGIPDLASRGDLADRAIVVRLPPLPTRMTEREWAAAVDAILPATFTAFLNALTYGLRALEATPTPHMRMADFARFIVAAEPALPWEAGAFVAAYQRSRQQAVGALAEGDAVAKIILEFMKARSFWGGRMSDLYDELSVIAHSGLQRPQDWPGNARWLSDRIRRAAPALRALGIDISDQRTAAGSEVTIRNLTSFASSASPERNAPGDHACADDASDASDASDANEPLHASALPGWSLRL